MTAARTAGVLAEGTACRSPRGAGSEARPAPTGGQATSPASLPPWPRHRPPQLLPSVRGLRLDATGSHLEWRGGTCCSQLSGARQRSLSVAAASERGPGRREGVVSGAATGAGIGVWGGVLHCVTYVSPAASGIVPFAMAAVSGVPPVVERPRSWNGKSGGGAAELKRREQEGLLLQRPAHAVTGAACPA